jgi:hypothetical protein
MLAGCLAALGSTRHHGLWTRCGLRRGGLDHEQAYLEPVERTVERNQVARVGHPRLVPARPGAARRARSLYARISSRGREVPFVLRDGPKNVSMEDS